MSVPLPRVESGEQDGPSDAHLIAAVRAGDGDAYGHLYRRHVAAAHNLARQLTRSTAERDDLVAEAFAKVLDTLRAGGGPDIAFRAYLLTALRNTLYDRVRRDRRLELSDDMTRHDPGEPWVDTAVADFETTVAARAFARLPERWQTVLWHTEVEQETPAQVAPVLGLSPNGVAALAYRAREGLRQAYLQEHLADAGDKACRHTVERLGAWARGGLSRRSRAQVDGHLESCAQCRPLAGELADVNSSLRGLIVPAVLGGGALVAAYLAATPEAAAAAAGAGGSAAAGGGVAAAGGGAAGTAGGAVEAGAAAAGSAGGAAAAGAAGAGGAAAGAGAAGAGGAAATGGGSLVGWVVGTGVGQASAAAAAAVVVGGAAVVGFTGDRGTEPAAAPPAATALPAPAEVTGSGASPTPAGPSGTTSPTPRGSVPPSGPGAATGDAPGPGGGAAPPAPAPAPAAPPAGPGAGARPTLDVGRPEATQPLRQGESGLISIAVRNAGPGAANRLTATVALPAGVTLSDDDDDDDALSDWTCTDGGPAVTCRLAALPPDRSRPLRLAVQVTDSAVAGPVSGRVTAQDGAIAAAIPATVIAVLPEDD